MSNTGRIIGIDVGTKRVGLARTDPLQLSVNPIGTFHREEVVARISEMVEKEGVVLLVVGWPLEQDGSEGKMTRFVGEFINEVRNKIPDIPIERIDERYTSKRAVDAMIQAGVPRMKRREKGRVDRMAATLILKEYLERGDQT